MNFIRLFLVFQSICASMSSCLCGSDCANPAARLFAAAELALLEGYQRPVIVRLGGGALPTHAAFIGIVCPFPTHLHGPDDFDIGTIVGGIE